MSVYELDEIMSDKLVLGMQEKKTLDSYGFMCDELWKKEVQRLLKENESLVNEENRIATHYVHHLEVKTLENFKAKTYPTTCLKAVELEN